MFGTRSSSLAIALSKAGLLVLVLYLGWFTSFSSLRSPIGKHCPTAAVQTVAVPVYDCCHKLVSISFRVARPGDKEFLQCRCAEKSSIEHKSIASPKLDLSLPPLVSCLDRELRLTIAMPHCQQTLANEQFAPEPPIPPPLNA